MTGRLFSLVNAARLPRTAAEDKLAQWPTAPKSWRRSAGPECELTEANRSG
ncbi:MAG TPA: hypothetical protein VGD53_31215 [Actinoallomurus sp.]